VFYARSEGDKEEDRFSTPQRRGSIYSCDSCFVVTLDASFLALNLFTLVTYSVLI